MGGLEYLLPHGIPSQIECTDDSGMGAFRPCNHCGSVLFNIEPGKGPHYLALRCAGCGKGHRWINEAQAENLKSPVGYFEQANEDAP